MILRSVLVRFRLHAIAAQMYEVF